MNQDEEITLDQKIKLPQRDSKCDVEFLKSVQERALGFKTTRNVSAFHLQACAEDELVKKQFKEMRCEIPGVPRSTFLMVFSPDGTKVASTHGNHHIYVTDVRTGKHIKTLIGHPRTPWCVAFHPSSDQIIGSGCLGGQVRIWDLSGGSEVWTAESQTVIASIAFHPDDRLLVIATYNELFFWDWSKPEPFMHVATATAKEKVRYVAFDKLGHKLITGITNSPQTRWERVRAPVPVPRPADRAASPYRRRITPRLIASIPTPNPPMQHSLTCTARNSRTTTPREPLSSVPERERRITTCYRDLVQQYEVLVHRYLQIYRPPVMVDQGTDPMEDDEGIDVDDEVTTSTSSNATIHRRRSVASTRSKSPKPSTSGVQKHKKSNIHSMPSKYISKKKSESSSSTNSPSKQSKTNRPTHKSNQRTKSIGSTQTAEQRESNLFINDVAASLSSSSPLNSSDCTIINPDEPSTSDGRLNTDPDMDFHVRCQKDSDDSSSSDDDSDRVFLDSLRRVKERRYDKVVIENIGNDQQHNEIVVTETPQTQEVEPPDSAVYTYLNLARRGDTEVPRERPSSNKTKVKMTKRYVVPMLSSPTNTTNTSKPNHKRLHAPPKNLHLPPKTLNTPPKNLNLPPKSPPKNLPSQKFNAPTTMEQKYKMRIKYSVGSTTTTTEDSSSPPVDNSAAASTSQTNDNISDLIRNAELMLAKFRENLEQRGHLQGTDLPSTSRSIVAPQQPTESHKPSRGTNTNETDKSQPTPTKNESNRKRLYHNSAKKSNRHHPIILDSSDSSSSDNDQNPKRSKFSANKSDAGNEHTYAASVSNPNSNNDHCYAENNNTDSPEHSYAGPSEPKSDNTMRLEINVSPVETETTSETITDIQANPITAEEVSAEFPAPINFNAELELLVTDLLTNDETTASTPATEEVTTENIPNTDSPTTDDRVCGACGGALEDRRRADNNSNNTSTPVSACPRFNSCVYTPPDSAPRSNVTGSSDPPRRRFLSHRLSAFHPTRQVNQSPRMYTVRSPNSLQPLIRSRLGNLNSTENPTRSPNFASDEVINYAERVNEEENTRGYHPFDPPPELMSINPEHIGIGNMYSNIVQELESSLSDVRNIRANRRLGETSDMLSSFSERLESIMTQSNTILRNLSSSLDSLPVNESEPASPDNVTRVVYRSMRSHGLIMRNSPEDPLYDLVHSPSDYRGRNVFTNNPSASDHTYPLNPDNPQSAANMSPLMLSLHLTVSHIQRQARLLRQQVESIERIDRAMLEVAQLQMMRQMFDELHRHFSTMSESDNPIAVSSVRQMMAGTRISDSSPYDSPSDDNPLIPPQPPVAQNEEPATPSTSNASQETQTHNNRTRARKTYPRCLFLMHRQFRRTSNAPTAARKCTARERLARKNLYRRYLPTRGPNRPSTDTSSSSSPRRGYLNIVNPETLPSMTRRLEHFLMEHGRYIGRSIIPPTSGSSNRSDVGEHIMMLRQSNCRQRLNRLLGIGEDRVQRNEFTSVTTIDGSSRFGARQTLTSILDTLTRFMEVNNNAHITTVFRYHMWEVIELSLLLSEILLLQIVDSIPPPTGMNLDPERESLSTRIDQMCSRMLQSRISSQSVQLTRSLRLLRITVRHATQALGQTYTARRNAMLPINTDSERLDSRQGLLDDIHNCLRNIRRHRETATRLDEDTNPTGTEWYRTINDLISRYTNSPSNESPSSSVLNNETGEETRPSVTVEDANSSDDNISATTTTRESLLRPLYRTSNVNLLHNEEASPSGSRHRLWNVPTVQVNDVPVSEPQHSPWHPRFVANRQRLSERLDELRTTGGLFRPRFLHPLYGGVYPFDGDLDDPHREQIYDSDIVATVTPNHRIQVWEFSQGNIPNITNASKNVVVTECKIHNDASVDFASDGSILVTLLPSGGYMNVTNRLGVYSLEWETLGQCLYVTSFEQNAVSVSLSPLSRHLVVGLASRRVPIMPSDRWTMARIFLLDDKEAPYGKLSPIRELEQNRDTSYMSVNCIRWLPSSGQGLVFATNTGHLRFLT